MSRVRDSLHFLFRKLGMQIVRSSRSRPLEQLTGVRNVLNGPDGPSRSVMERLGQVSLALQLEWLVRDFEIDCVLDVGANNGQFAGELRELGYRSRIASFEPMVACIPILRALAARDAQWTIYPFGLGREAGEHRLTHFADPTFSSVHPIKPDAKAEFGHLVEPTGWETVELRTLNDVWAEAVAANGARRVMLKTDTQGHDLEVLQGAEHHLPECTVVLCEVSFAPIYDGTPDYHTIFRFLEERGFECVGINPLCYRTDRPALIEANAVFINSAVSRQLTTGPKS